ncbi:unnamed protein product [Closterium sp. NIES-53]
MQLRRRSSPSKGEHTGMWIFKVKRPPGLLPVSKVRYVARGFSQREGVDFFQTFGPTPKMTTLWVLLYAPREWHDTLRNSLAARKFCPLSADPSLFVRSGPTPFFVLVYVDDLVQQVLQQFELQHSTTQPTPLAVEHRLNGPFPDESFESSGPNAELVGCLYELRILALVVSSRLFKYSRNEQGVNRTHGRKGGAQSPMAPKKAMVRNLPKGLGEQISQVAVKSHILHIELLKLDKVTDKEVPNFDVLGASVVYEILGEVDAALIVTPEGGSGLRVAKLLG